MFDDFYDMNCIINMINLMKDVQVKHFFCVYCTYYTCYHGYR